ncbi:MAG: zinc ribbon domain-containing protein [Polyangiaceae bacterium]|jgi:hypothetical protein
MGMIQFVQNHEDLSTDRGYQFKFFCDKCHNGYMTRFQTSALGVAESALRVAGSLFGGFFDTASHSAYEIQRAVGGPAHDAALEAAVAEGKQYFHQCTRCGRWVCPEVCWNAEACLCEACAPNFKEEMASAHAQAKAAAMRQQMQDRASKTDYVAGIDMAAEAVRAGPIPTTEIGDRCNSCGAAIGDGHFCARCGAPRPSSGCAACGAPMAPDAHFCPGCGHKLA